MKCLGQLNRPHEALPFARQAAELEPVDAAVWGNLAMCLLQCGEREEARRAIDFAVDLDPTDQINLTIRDNFEHLLKKS